MLWGALIDVERLSVTEAAKQENVLSTSSVGDSRLALSGA